MTRTQFHTLPVASDMFSSDFLRAHVVDDRFEREAYIEADYLSLLSEAASRNGLPTGQNILLLGSSRSSATSVSPGEPYKKYFDQVGFSEGISRAIAAANSFVLPSDTIALHLRSGDIVFGRQRQTPRFIHKVIPLPYAASIARELVGAGKCVIVFGQDPIAIAQLVKIGAIAATRVPARQFATSTQNDMFDMVLMSRCTELYGARQSAFASLAAMIGSRSVLNPITQENPHHVLERIDAEYRRPGAIHDLNMSHAYKFVYYGLGRRISEKERDNALEKSLRIDPENPLYQLTLACNLIRKGQLEAADNVLRILTDREFANAKQFPSRSMNLLCSRKKDRKFLLKRERKAIIKNGLKGFPFIDLYAAYLLYNKNRIHRSSDILGHSPLLSEGHPVAAIFKNALDGDVREIRAS